MDKSILKSRIESMDLNELVTFINANLDPYAGVWMPKIYDLNDHSDLTEMISEIVKDVDDLCQVKHYLCQIDDTDRYANLCEGVVVSWTTKEEMLDRFCNLDDLTDCYADYEESDLWWPETEPDDTQD